MDLFGRKAKARVIELEQHLADSEKDRRDLAIALRDLDQGIFNMSQKTNWVSMRPEFVKLCELANVRMVAEHKRITSLLLPELDRTYNR